MPTINYDKTLIYKIVSLDLELSYAYVGHTTDFVKRRARHKSDSKTKEIKLYQMIRANGGWNNWQMILVEEFPCGGRLEACQRERYWFEQLNANLNMISPSGIIKCEHQKLRSKCKDCGGGSICEHQKERRYCRDCGGNRYCEHQKERRRCLICQAEKLGASGANT